MGISPGLGKESDESTGDLVLPRLLEMEPLGVLRFLVGKRPNWAVCRDDMDEAERGDPYAGDMADAEETEE